MAGLKPCPYERCFALCAKAHTSAPRMYGAPGYQITAVLLTYAAVAVAFIPIVMAQQVKDERVKTHATQSADGTKKEPASEKAADTSEQHGMLYSIGWVLGLGLISPLYELSPVVR